MLNLNLMTLNVKVKTKTGRSRSDRPRWMIADLNPTLPGWFADFKHQRPVNFGNLDGFVRRRLTPP